MGSVAASQEAAGSKLHRTRKGAAYTHPQVLYMISYYVQACVRHYAQFSLPQLSPVKPGPEGVVTYKGACLTPS